MANPLSDRGISDRDYAAAVGTLVGEAAVGANLQDYQAIADVIANRIDDKAFASQYGKTIAGQTMRPNEFSTWSPKQSNAYQNAVMGFTAALNPARIDQMPAAMQERVAKAQQAVNDVFATGVARGITQGATFYDNPDVTAQLGTGGFHNRLERSYGSTIIGDHRFTGPGFRPDQPFDPINYNGMLGIPDAAPVDFSGVPFNEDRYSDFSTQIDPVPSGRVDFGGFLDAPANLAGFSLSDAAPTNFSGVDQYGPTMGELGFSDMAPSGFHSGVDGWGAAPDFNAPSLDDRIAAQQAQDRIDTFAGHQLPGISYGNFDKINADIMDELAPKVGPAPQLDTAPLDTQSMYAGALEDKIGVARNPSASSWAAAGMPSSYAPNDYAGMFDGFAAPPKTADIPAFNATPASLPDLGPAINVPSAPSFAAPTPDYAGLVGSTYGMGKPMGGFLDAMANPNLATAFGRPQTQVLSINPFSGIASAIGDLFGGGGAGAYAGSGMAGDTYSNSKGFRDPGGWSLGNLDKGLADALMDGSAYGQPSGGFFGNPFSGLGSFMDRTFGTGWDGRGGGTGDTGFGGGTRGDGSYSSQSGYNDNNPQGIL